MAFKFLGKAAVPVLAVALIATSTVGIAVASSKSSGAKACETKKGVLVLASSKGKCAHGDKKVTLGKTGATGKTGPKGDSGTNGLAGPSAAYVDTVRNLSTLSIGDNFATLSLPKGSYLLNASLNFHNTDTGAENPGCYFQTGSAKSVEYQTLLPPQTGTSPLIFVGLGELAFSSAVTLTAAGTVTLVCGASSDVSAQGSFSAQVTGALVTTGGQPFA